MLTKFLILLFLSTWINNFDVKQNDKPTAARHKTYKPDTTINKALILENWQSIENQFGDVMPFVKDTDDGPFVYFKNNTGTEYLKMYFFPGSGVNEFSFFEVGKVEEKLKPLLHPSSFKSFYTESGIRLGMSKKKLLAIKGNAFQDSVGRGCNILKYRIEDTSKLKSLKRYNEPTYLAEYYFDNEGLLYRFRFGFEYP